MTTMPPLSLGCPLICSSSTRRVTHLGHRISTSWVLRSGDRQCEQNKRGIVTNESDAEKEQVVLETAVGWTTRILASVVIAGSAGDKLT